MKRLMLVSSVTIMTIGTVFTPAWAGDAWYDQLRTDYKYQKRRLDREHDLREDQLADWHRQSKNQLDDMRREALTAARGDARNRLADQFRDRQKALEAVRDQQERDLDSWYDRHLDLVRNQYDSAKDWMKYPEAVERDFDGPTRPGHHTPVDHRHRGGHRAPPGATVSRDRQSAHQNSPRKIDSGVSWVFRYR